MKTLLIVMMLGLAACATKRPAEYGRVIDNQEPVKKSKWDDLNRERFFKSEMPEWYEADRDGYIIRAVVGAIDGLTVVRVNFAFKEDQGMFFDCFYTVSIDKKHHPSHWDFTSVSYSGSPMLGFDHKSKCSKHIGRHEITFSKSQSAMNIDGYIFTKKYGISWEEFKQKNQALLNH